jgi:branched-subunit amino acid transport protein AzlD
MMNYCFPIGLTAAMMAHYCFKLADHFVPYHGLDLVLEFLCVLAAHYCNAL